ncbi:hypothetical protein [Actinoplanes sp. NPDC051411]|jgi:hypothetical protein|uniref:hypothetical protein n=1 Tax=Actinoplanes sp. NPDC051411 TaxID=3155522 RepID=UPI003433D1A2
MAIFKKDTGNAVPTPPPTRRATLMGPPDAGTVVPLMGAPDAGDVTPLMGPPDAI